MSAGRRFNRLVAAEWTKLRTVRRWVIALAAVVPLSVTFALLTARGNQVDPAERNNLIVGPNGLAVNDSFHFMHHPMTGDGTVTAHVVSQDPSNPFAGAGVMIKSSIRPGAAYAALMLTPSHGVRLNSNFDTDISGGGAQWLRLTRSGTAVTGFVSTDGVAWRRVGTVSVPQLGAEAQVGVFVSSPPQRKLKKQLGSTSVRFRSTQSSATFDNVVTDQPVAWASDDIGRFVSPKGEGPAGATTSPAEGVYTLAGTGEMATSVAPDDPVEALLFGLFFGLMALLPIAVVFVTSEHKRPLIRLTFAATPARASVVAAKALVVGGVSFALGLIGAMLSYALAMPLLRASGFEPPMFTASSLSDPAVWRAIVGSAVLLAALAVFSVGVATIVRHTAAGITAALALIIVPMFVSSPLPIPVAKWLMYLTPAGGFAIQRAKAPDVTLAEPWAGINPLLGLAAAGAYAVVALATAMWLVRRRDA